MDLKNILKLKEENYPLFLLEIEKMEKEVPKYMEISEKSLQKFLVHASDPSIKDRIKSSLKEMVENTDFRDQVSIANRKNNKPYAIYEGKKYTLVELTKILGISRVSIGNMKKGIFLNRFNLEFIKERKSLTENQKNKISGSLKNRGPKFFAIYKETPYTFNRLLEVLEIKKTTLFNLKRGLGKVDKYNLKFL